MGIPFCGMRQPENGVEWCLLGWTGFQAAFGVAAGAGLSICKNALLLRQTAFRAETFAKPTTDSLSAARRHLGKPVMLCLISHLTASRRRSILDFRLPLGFCRGFRLPYCAV